MSFSARHRSPTWAFTLVEMIGVLAVVAILTSLLVPRVVLVIGDSRINQAATAYATVKAAAAEYYGKHGRFGGTNGMDLGLAPGGVYEDWDLRCLVTEGFLERPFAVRIGNGRTGSASGGSRVHVVNILNNGPGTAPASDGTVIDRGAYNLDGANQTNDIAGVLLVEACIEGVDNQDARDLSDRVDGTALGVVLGSNDQIGRVKYALGTNGLASVRMYVAHR